MGDLTKLVTDLIKKNNQNNIKRVMAKVTYVYNLSKARVQIIGTDTEVALPNKTGEKLKEGDYVHIHYWGNIASGYLAIKNGDVTPAGGNIDDKTVTSNGIYYAETDGLDGYGKVTVEVEPDLGDITVTTNGTYRASSSGYEGFDTVEVDVPTVTPQIGQIDKALIDGVRMYMCIGNRLY